MKTFKFTHNFLERGDPGSFVLAICLLAWTIPGFSKNLDTGQQTLIQQRTVRNDGQSSIPAPGGIIDSEISAGEAESYDVKLNHGEFIQLELFSMGTDLLVTATGPNHQQAGKWYAARALPQPIAWIADLPGTYRLQISILKGSYTNQNYRVKSVSQRRPTPQDRKRIAGSQLQSAAIALNREWNIAALVMSVKKYQEAFEMWHLLDDLHMQAFVLCQIGEVYKLISENKKAMDAYVQAQRIDAGPEIKARILNSLGQLYKRESDNPKSIKCLSEALEISRSTGDRWSEGMSLQNMGIVYYLMSNNKEAQKLLYEALSIRESIRDYFGLAETHLNLAYTFHAQKNFIKANKHYEQSLQFGQEMQDIDIKASALLGLGRLMSTFGEWQKAFGFYDEAMGLFKTMGDRTNQNSVLDGMAYTYRGMGQKQRALELYKKTAATAGELGDTYVEFHALAILAQLYQEIGNYDQAIRHCQHALMVNKEGRSAFVEASVLATMGRVYEKQGDIPKSRDYYGQALALYRKAEDRFLEGLLLNSIGQTFHLEGNNQKALQYFSEALSLQINSGDVINTPGTLYNIALAQRNLGDLDDALKNIDEAIRSTESLRVKVADPEFRASYNASVNDIHKYAIDLLMESNRQQPNAGSDAEALKANERALARSLLESLTEARANIKQGVDSKLLEQEHDLQQKLNNKGQEQMTLLRKKNTPEQVAALSKEIDDLATEYHKTQSQIRYSSPRYAALTQPQPINVQQIQQDVLDPDTLLLEFALGEERSFLWAVTPTSLNTFDLPSRTEIEKATRRVRELMLAYQPQAGVSPRDFRAKIKNAETQFSEASAALSRMLFGKAAHLFEKKRLVIVAEGALQYLPFSALPEPLGLTADNAAENRAEPLISNHEIVNLPSSSVLAALRKETRDRPVPPKMIAVFADPVFENDDPRLLKKQIPGAKTGIVNRRPNTAASSPQGRLSSSISASKNAPKPEEKVNTLGTLREGLSLSRLPATRNEAEAILAFAPADLRLKALDFDASLSTLNNANLSQYRVLHFATHGLLDSEHPELSALVLSLVDEQGRSQNGFLRLSDIYNLDLSAQLVVLSACNTGLGKEVRGEGLVGIVRGFMYAGAPRVIASLWKVEDEATAELMKRFYQHLFEKGEPAATALHAAQIEISQMKRWKAPYFWAPFVLQGEWK
jgi:tetratricopeptide (TPR) repeat protein